jgi:hypothetical protein
MPKRKSKQRGGATTNQLNENINENTLKKRKGMIYRLFSLLAKDQRMSIMLILFILVPIVEFISQFATIPNDTKLMINLIFLMIIAFIGGTYFRKFAFQIISVLILLQIGGLFYVNFEHRDFISKDENIPQEYNIFMTTSLSVICSQLLIMILTISQSISGNLFSLNNWFLVSLFLLLTVISAVSIGQIWVILGKLKCDC